MATIIKKLINFYMSISHVKLMAGFVIAMAIILSISVNANATTNYNHKTVKRTEYAVTIDVSVKDGLTYVKTSDGNVWAFEWGDSDVGDIYKVTFNTMNTKEKPMTELYLSDTLDIYSMWRTFKGYLIITFQR